MTETRAINFQLEVGGINQTVQVTATTEALDVDTSTLGETIQSQTMLDLPDSQRNVFDFALLVPGVNNGVPGSSESGASTPHIGGSRNGNNDELFDGMTNILPENNVGNNIAAYTPVEDSIQEENVMVSVPEAEYGRFSGGIISLITKSGANQVHGSFYEFIQNGALDAIPFGAPGIKNGNAKPDMHQYETGGSIGGPIFIPHVFNGHNKAFFFFDYEDYRRAQGTTSTYSVPNPAWFGGDFTSLFGSTTPVLYDPDTVANVGGTFTRQPFVVGGKYNIIPAGRISPVTQKALGYFPKPNVPNAGEFSNYQQTGSVPTDYWHFDRARRCECDPEVAFLLALFAAGPERFHSERLQRCRFAGQLRRNLPHAGLHRLVQQHDHFFSHASRRIPVRLREAELQPRARGRKLQPRDSFGFDPGFVTQAGLEAQMFPHFGFGGNGGFSDLGPLGYEQYQEDPLAQDINGSIVKIVGGHSLKFGGDFTHLARNNFLSVELPVRNLYDGR